VVYLNIKKHAMTDHFIVIRFYFKRLYFIFPVFDGGLSPWAMQFLSNLIKNYKI